MSNVLILMIIPNKDYEEELNEREKLRFDVSPNKRVLKTIKEIKERKADQPLEKVVKEQINFLGIRDALWEKSDNERCFHVIFPVDLEDSDFVIQHLKNFGVGIHLDSSIGIIPFSLFSYNDCYGDVDFEDTNDLSVNGNLNGVSNNVGNFKEKQSNFLKSITSRLTVAQIVNSVRSDASVTFDFICYLIFASWIAAMGLVENSVISLVASMLVSPMMGPVLAVAFGAIIKDRMLLKMGGQNIFVCFLVTIGFGFFFGMIVFNFTDQWADQEWPTNSMSERGVLRVLWVGTLVAFPSGCAVAVSLLSGNSASLVGVAISVSLLPPAVNAGLLWAYSFLKFLYSIGQPHVETISKFTNETIYLPQALIPQHNYNVIFNDNMSIETLILGTVSLGLSVINITNILIGALLLLKIKEIAPLKTLSPVSRRFFQHDIKIAREYNENNKNLDMNNIENEILNEYAGFAGLNQSELHRPEASNVRRQTLFDIARDIEADEVYQHVTKNAKHSNNITRRMSQSLIPHFLNSNNRSGSVHSFSHIQTPSVIISNIQDSPRSNRASFTITSQGNRRRISNFALSQFYEKAELSPKSMNGIDNLAFNFNDNDIQFYSQQRSNAFDRRNSSSMLRTVLQNTEHSPYSLWPSTMQPSPLVPRSNDLTITSLTSSISQSKL